MNEEFWEYVKVNLSAKEYEELPRLIGCAPKRLAWLKSGSTEFALEEIQKLAQLLKRNPLDLIMEYLLGEGNISFKELRQLAAAQGYEIKLLAHAA
ncbi:hypothetical protein [Flavilitoribacter nigricans]|uniref:XRE family transcriptional regulator n=1 Tax=Flavilitoribacter nigricans (strain ATCC 23147 / DSM 23189 / NBRC 102662 / NCIMB 1420 / SS-2) TaxID=1122177 RepID=A0A2D0NED9_FLAN2|nr:hypothetical protein [Flavilitoribacter nigricans]PHN06143.1 hypothetical protein CRP01_11200 [Flavilitoribacter nigricans DSM 23189 = NBRC 102662]